MAGKTAILVGATGLIGSHCLQQLLESPAYRRVIAVSRRPVPIKHKKLVQIETAFDLLDTALEGVKADDAFCCLGTTIREAGTKAEFHKVDYGYVLSFAHRMRANGVTHFLLVSAIGANPQLPIFYSKVKGLVERDVLAIGFPKTSIFRPSLLLGDRAEERPGEAMGARVSALISPLFVGPLRRMHPIRGSDVATAMVACAVSPSAENSPARELFYYDHMQALVS